MGLIMYYHTDFVFVSPSSFPLPKPSFSALADQLSLHSNLPSAFTPYIFHSNHACFDIHVGCICMSQVPCFFVPLSSSQETLSPGVLGAFD